MNQSERTKEALLAKTEALCTSIVDNRKDDPWGGDGYLSTILRTVKMHEANDYSSIDSKTTYEPVLDYATSAQKELVIKEQSAALIKTAQDISTLIRDLQELWLFGGLDTLADPADEEANRTKARAVAEMIEALAKQGPGEARESGTGVAKKEDTNGGGV
ncbi:actin-binding cofilin tropomyosin type [Stemphylium lycopersici]|uniref:Actin-binding cofilin tropomyosin type n=1 Tax=Stemphylium lycopersici TaxID=183478 RepID=A0A364N4E7_STELY|nr:actin-binding cofilin tropomyosin type [Stemphylium lycopersici]RAR08109.1 actin-binding cofilin tropomyosin type [Stemphylium lycopersici]RAR11753.1 actin-binding cofilin tropomyosin type [Stemphylium lycopersici]